jgi:type VI secretion system protein ImpA
LTRDDVLNRLADASALLLQMEPHSPIAYLVQRAVRLARLPLPELMRVLVRDQNVLGQLDRDLDLGLEKPDAAKEAPKPPGKK